MRKECTESTSTCSSSCSVQRGPSERAGSLGLGLSLSLSLPFSTSHWLSRRHSLDSLQTAAAAAEEETIFLVVPELSIPGGFQSTLSDGRAPHWTSLRPHSVDFDSQFPPRALPFLSFLFLFLRSPRCSLELSNGKLTGGAPAGSGSGSSTGEGEGVHLRHRFDVACISRRRRRRLAQKVRWRPERAITCFDIKPAGCGRRRSRSVAAAVGKATDSDRAAHEL